MNEVRQILGLNDQQNRVNEVVTGPNGTQQAVEIAPAWGGSRKPYVGQVPGRNMLVVRANKVQLAEIDELIRHADIPPFQVVIKGLVYTANEDRLKDIGIQTTITAATGDNRTSGGIFGQPVGVGGTLFDFSTLIGTVDFNVQANALQRNGVISIKSRPFATVLDGDTTDLTVGRQVPVIVQAVNNLGGAPGTLQILQAANLLSVTPHVIDDDQGNPTAVNLELQLESNDVDTSVLSQGVPSVSVRSIQSKFILTQEQTAILGGFTVDSDSKTISKTPGLGDIPVLGELFKRRVRSNQINRLYFAISVTVIPYGGAIEPVIVPGATTPPPSITEKMLERGKEPTPVVPPVKTGP
jgi:type II secretory pathway component GspD/PulD (secretin)